MKPTKRMSRRQMLRYAEKIAAKMNHNSALFPAPPVDMQRLERTALELYHGFGGLPSEERRYALQRKADEVKESLRLLQEYVKEKMNE